MNTGLVRERGIGLIALFKMFTQEDEREVGLSEIENIDEELKTPSKYLKSLMENYGTEPKNVRTTRKTTKIKGASFNKEQKVQENVEKTRRIQNNKSLEDEEKSL